MKHKIRLRKFLVLCKTFCLVLFAVLVLFLISDFIGKIYFKNKKVIIDNKIIYNVPDQNLASSDFKNPIILKIPKIHINAIVELMGVTSGGIMDVPKLPINVGWYNLGVRPGEKGSSVIDGHSGLFNGKPAVFDDLYKLNIGDEISVQDGTGEIFRFVVHDFKTYEEKDDTSDVFSSVDGKSHLNLITCEPAWNEIQKKYFKRLVVFTDKLD